MWRATAMMARITCSTMTMVKPRCDKLSDQCYRLIDLGWIKPGHDFIEQQQPGLRRQRARHLQPALVDGGEVLCRGLLAGREADELDGLASLRARRAGILVAQKTRRS